MPKSQENRQLGAVEGLFMRIDGPFLKVFRIMARTVGVIWILVGVGFLISAVVVSELRFLDAGIGVFLLIAGAAFIFAKAPTAEDLQRIRGFTGKH